MGHSLKGHPAIGDSDVEVQLGDLAPGLNTAGSGAVLVPASVTGSVDPLPLKGLAATSGNNAGGAIAQTGGVGFGTGAGGAASQVGGASGSGATGNGGASSVTGGAAVSTAGTGGAASVTGGLGTTTGAGGAASLTGGVGGSSGTGGAVVVAGGASAGAGGTAGGLTLHAGAVAGGTGGSTKITKGDGTTKLIEANETGLGFFAATPVAKPTAAANVTNFVAGSGTASKSDSTWTGVSGATAYTVGDLVTALKGLGLITA